MLEKKLNYIVVESKKQVFLLAKINQK